MFGVRQQAPRLLSHQVKLMEHDFGSFVVSRRVKTSSSRSKRCWAGMASAQLLANKRDSFFPPFLWEDTFYCLFLLLLWAGYCLLFSAFLFLFCTHSVALLWRFPCEVLRVSLLGEKMDDRCCWRGLSWRRMVWIGMFWRLSCRVEAIVKGDTDGL